MHSEMRKPGIVLTVQPWLVNESCAKDIALYAKRKGVNLSIYSLKRRLPTLPRENRSTIGVSELNFSVRNGKRWNLTAITT